MVYDQVIHHLERNQLMIRVQCFRAKYSCGTSIECVLHSWIIVRKEVTVAVFEIYKKPGNCTLKEVNNYKESFGIMGNANQYAKLNWTSTRKNGI